MSLKMAMATISLRLCFSLCLICSILHLLGPVAAFLTQKIGTSCRRHRALIARKTTLSILPEPSHSKFGRQDYWDDLYKQSDIDKPFSWYSEWPDLEPFVTELLSPDGYVLVPGIGNDGAIVGMYDAGYHNMTAFDYAPEGVNCARSLLGPNRVRTDNNVADNGVDLLVADGRDLPFDCNLFDGAFEKGTLDAIYLSGGHDKKRSAEHLQMAVSELARVIRPGGVVVSITAACVAAVQAAFDAEPTVWKQIRDGDFYMTSDGYASNNIDGTLLAWQLRPESS